MMNAIRHATFGVAALCLMTVSPLAQAAEGEGWDWAVIPYGWAAGVSADLNLDVPPFGGGSNDTEFGDIIDKIDGAFEIHVEGQGDRFGVFADFTYLGLADNHDFERFSTSSDLDTRLFEMAAVWSPGDDRFRGLDVFGGLRYIDVDFSADLDPVDPAFATTTIDTGDSFSDFMLGARYTWDLSDRWGMTLRGDGSFGDTDGTWNASAVAQYHTTHGAWIFGYRYLSVGLEPIDGHHIDIDMHGPMIGYAFIF